MSKERKIIIVLAALLVIFLLLWIFSVPFPLCQSEGKKWRRVKSWDYQIEYGSEKDYNLTTEQFRIEGEEWRIRWGCHGITGGSHFRIIVYDGYTDQIIKEIVTNPFENTHYGETYLADKGRFYLKIYICGSLEKWFVFVEEYR